jgi:hypothetical protein
MKSRRWLIFSLIPLAMVATAQRAAADGEGTGGDVCYVDCGPAADDFAQSADRTQLEAAYYDVLYGSGSVQAFLDLASTYARNYDDDSAMQVPVDPPPADAVLAMDQVAQANDHYCGPASGVMILRYLHAGRSAANNATLDQASVAGPAHMQADDGATEWLSYRFRIGLNEWLRGHPKGYYTEMHNPSGQQFKNAVIYDVLHNHPLGAGTVESANLIHYNGHPKAQLIGHWIVPHGYFNNGGKTRFADPATSPSVGWPNIAPKFTYDTTDFANTFLNNNGMVR